MLLYIVRHGDPDYQHDRLTGLGQRQAEALVSRFTQPITHIYSSPMGRAVQTAEPLCNALGMQCKILPWLQEIGDEGYTHFPDGKRRFLITLPPEVFRTGSNLDLGFQDAFQCDGLRDTQIEDYSRSIGSESDAFLARHGYIRQGDHYRALRENSDRIVLFTHNGFARLWLSQLLHVPLHIMFSSFTMTPTGVTVVQFPDSGECVVPVCLCFSDMSHLLKQNMELNHRSKILL